MITYGSTTLTSYNSIVKTEVYYYKSTSATSLSGGSWSTTKPTWENGKYIWQKIRTVYEDGTHTESDPVNITGQQGATGTAAYSYKLNSSDSIIGKTKDGEYTIKKITFSATYKQGTGAVSAYGGRFKIKSTTNGSTWKTEYTSSGNEASKEFTIPDDIIAIKCSLYQSDGATVLLDIVTVPVVKDGVDAIGLRDSIPYYLASDKDTGITRLTQGWTRYRPQLTAEKKYLWVYYVSRYSEGTTEPELIEIKDDLVHFVNNGDESPVESCVVDIEPVQDLHGYDHPWPAGGGKNLLQNNHASEVINGVTFTVHDDGTVTANGTASADTDFDIKSGLSLKAGSYVLSGCPAGGSTSTYRIFATNVGSDTGSSLAFVFSKTTQTTVRINIKSGTAISNLLFKPMICLSDAQDPTTFAPYENICPISGWTEVDVYNDPMHGGNIEWNQIVKNTNANITLNGITATKNDDGSWDISGTASARAVIPFDNVVDDFIIPGHIYAIFGCPEGGSASTFSFGIGGLVIDLGGGIIWTNTRYSRGNSTFVVFSGQTVNFQNVRPQIFDLTQMFGEGNEPSTVEEFKALFPNDYYPYNTGEKTTVSAVNEKPYTHVNIQLGQTVYGGKLDVLTGKLVVDRAMVDLGDYNWTMENDPLPGTARARENTSLFNIYVYNQYPVCSILKGDMPKSFRQIEEGCICFSNAEALPMLRLRSQTFVGLTDAEIKTALSGVQCCLKIKEPITYTLTPQEITMLTGQNHIFSDTGQTAISYYDNQTSTDPYVDYSATSTFEVAQSVSDAVGTLQAPYKEVEWVESTGKQYVYLDWKPPIKTWGFEIDFINRNAVGTSVGAWNESTNVNGYGSIFGVRNASGVNNCQLSSYSNGLLRIGNSTNIATGFKTDHSRQAIKLQGTTVTKTDGTTATVTRVDENTAKPYCNMTVFGVYNGLRCQDTGWVIEPSSTRIYTLKFYDGTTLTVDLVGAIRKADGVTGLYDKVSRHFYPAPGMLFGDEVGNINDTDTVAESLNKADVNVTVVNKNRTRMWETAVPFNRLEDGQKITVTYSYGNVVSSIETAELPEWDESTTSGNSRVYLKLTYPNGSKSEWIPCYYSQTARLTTHYGAGTPITFTYHENILSNATETGAGSPVVRGFFANPVYDSNYYDRRLHNNSIKAKDAITAYHLICGDEEGYQNIDASVSFDLGYPILYASGNIAATKTATNTYEAMPGINFTYTGTIQNGEANKMLWLKGTVNGNTFTVAFGDFLTTVTPTMEDGMYYIPLGVMASATSGYFSSSNRLYAYIDGAFQPVDTAAVVRAQDAKNLATSVYGTCSTTADTPLKEVVCENFILFDGVRIQVAFENANSTTVPSINVNNTGAKQILINQATVSESNQLLWAENAQLEFVYDGTYWVLQNAPYSLYGICSVTEEIPAKVIECAEAVICKGTTITVDFMYSNTSDNTVFNVANIAQKPLLVNGDTLKVNSRFNWHAGAVRTFYFDGQAWNMSDDIVSAYIDEYETEQDEDGIMVHPVGQKNTGWSIGSTLELLKNGVSYIKMWFDKVEEGEFSLPFIRIGKESGNHVLVGDDAVTIREDQKELAHYSSLGITFDDETPYKIGNDTTYIAFEDTDNDAKADSLRIVADSISFHSNGTEKDLRSELESLTENVDLNAQAIEQNSEIIENTQRYIQINPEVPSIKLATNDRNYLLIESNKLGFWVDANETAYMSQNQMNIPTASITNLLMQTTNAETGESIGQIGWVMRTNGHLSLKIMN